MLSNTINGGSKKMTICASEPPPNRRGQSPRSERGAPLPEARATRKIDLAAESRKRFEEPFSRGADERSESARREAQQADCQLFTTLVNKCL